MSMGHGCLLTIGLSFRVVVGTLRKLISEKLNTYIEAPIIFAA